MKLAIMQPYFFPYIGYWQLLSSVDVFVVYDNIQFVKNGWIHRNNITINDQTKLFGLPLEKASSTLNIVDRSLSKNSKSHILKVLAQIENSYKSAPYFDIVFPILKEIFLNNNKNLFEYIFFSINRICQYLDIKTKLIVSSYVDIDHNLKSQDRVIAISKFLGADEYINTMGGRHLYDFEVFRENGIELRFFKPENIQYTQLKEGFAPNLSIIDIMMFNSVKELQAMLKKGGF